MRPDSRLESLLPIAMAMSLLLFGVQALIVFGLLAALLLWSAGARGRSLGWLLPMGAVLALLALEPGEPWRVAGPDQLREQTEEAYTEVWRQLEDTAERTADGLRSHTFSSAHRLAVFRSLESEAVDGSPSVSTILLVDDRGVVWAWGGKGLLHDIEDLGSLAPGRYSLASFSAVTLVAVERFETQGRIWHIAAGTSLRTDTFPFAVTVPSPRWTVVEASTPSTADSFRVAAESGPELVVAEVQTSLPSTTGLRPSGWRRWACLVWGLSLLFHSWFLLSRASTFLPALTLAAGVGSLGLAAGVAPWGSLLLATAAVIATFNSRLWRWGESRVGALILGILAAISAPALAWVLQSFSAVSDLGSELWADPGDLALRLALALWCWALLSGIPREATGKIERFHGVGLVAVAGLLASAATMDRSSIAALCLVVGGGGAGIWLRQRRIEGAGNRLLVTALVAALLAATGWELAHRAAEEDRLERVLLPDMAPPTAGEIDSLADEMETFLASFEVARLVPAGFEQHSRQDLSFEIWRRSPLARYGGLSALRVLPRAGGLSSFSFGLPLNQEQWVDWTSPLLGTVPVPAWQDAVLVGDGVLEKADESWAYGEYALALQPGFRLQDRYGGDLAEVLLRSAPTAAAAAATDLGGVRYGLFEAGGQPILMPWLQSPELPADLLRGGVGRVTTPDGPSIAYSAVGADGVRILFLRQMSLMRALERIGTHALPTLIILALVSLALQMPRWIRRGWRTSWYHLWHSYSRRLVLVYSVLLLVPLGIINFLVVRAFEERLVREQEVAALRAVESVQGVLGEYVKALEPGFGIDAALDDELLNWLASVVHHDVNLYWRGSVYASSKAELFTAGLLPRRIPGEIYSGLTLLGHEVSMRTNRTGLAEYLELYAPLTVPGISFGQTRLIVSLPMLAQQEETRQQIASLRRRSLLGAAAVVLIVIAVGARLARRFTSPLTDIVEGTQRIASGESSLGLRPVELELATLVDAIDDMAGRIHTSRQELLREKSVVDRMVENITAGIVSLDEEGRVMMANRVAGEMIGLAVGQRLDEVVEGDEQRLPLAEFVASISGGALTQRTLMLEDPEGEEREWTVVWVPLPGEGEPSSLLVVEDVTEVLRGQRLQAWAEMARMIAHEIKNPLTPIRLSTEHMQEVFAADPESFSEVFESCTSNILSQVGELQEIASEFSTYSQIPKIEPRPGDLLDTVEEIVAAYRPASAGGVGVTLTTTEESVEVVFDSKMIGRAVRNLLENALRVAPKGTAVLVTVARHNGEAQIVVEDRGPGVEESLLARIFDPYFSTHDAGTGLGLPIAKQIAVEHGGDIVARNRDVGGLEVTITLPAG